MIPLNIEFHWPGTVIEIVLTVVLALLCRIVLHKLVRRAVAKADQRLGEHTALEMGRTASMVSTPTGLNTSRGAQRTKTLGSVLMSVTDAVLVVTVILTVLNSININIRPALASAGILGVAIGFGAQSLVKDLFAGIFMIMEDQYGVGDIIEIGELKGTVRSVGFRVTEVQDFNGEVWYLRNGNISTVGNVSQGFSQSFINLLVSIEEDPHRVIKVLTRMLERMDAEPDWHNKMLEAPTLLGLTEVDATTATYQVMIKCPPNEQWGVEREIRVRALTTMSQQGLRMPRQLIATVAAPGAESTQDMPSPVRRRRLSRGTRTRRRLNETEHTTAGEETTQISPRPAVLDRPHPDEQSEDAEATRTHQQAVVRANPPQAPVAPPEANEEDAPSATDRRKARAWLGNAANRSVRWVSATDTGHNMAAEETVVLDAEQIRKAEQERKDQRRGNQSGTSDKS